MATKDLTGINTIKFDAYASRTGSNLKFGIHDTGGTTTEITPNIISANTWQTVTWDISGVADADKNAIDTFTITPVDATAANTFYVDNFYYSILSSSYLAWKKGTAVINYGASGEGLIYMTASDSYSPKIDLLTHTGSPWTSITTQMRIGNVRGFLGEAGGVDLYGIYIGEANKYLKYDPTNGLQIKGYIDAGSVHIDSANELITVHDASNNIRVEIGKFT
jgi:hypothetical protein